VALARKDYARAVQLLEEVLNADPGAASIYAPLAMAYRGLGQTDRAESLARLWRNTELPVPDPLKDELDMSVQSGLAFELRGVRALDSGDYAQAADMFRQGIALAKPGTSLSRSLRHKLGTALALSGDTEGAVAQFEETLRLAPKAALDEPAAKASYSLGILHAGNGRPSEAIVRLEEALRFNPNYLEARVALGDVLRASGRPEASLEHYAEAVRMSPRNAWARFSHALALIRLRRYQDAKRWLEESVAAQPDRPELVNALARLLASAPDPTVRDGRRALALAQDLAKTHRNTDLGETLAMAFAEVGLYSDAAATQRDVLAAARAGGAEADVQRMAANLRLFEAGRPARTPWPDGDPIYTSVAR
jgi:tetratricopeptide (TPR) repeat protein